MSCRGNVMRTGRTNDLVKRKAQHARNPEFEDLVFDPVFRTDNYNEQRGLENLLYYKYNAPLDKIRAISPKNKNRQKYLDAADQFLKDFD